MPVTKLFQKFMTKFQDMPEYKSHFNQFANPYVVNNENNYFRSYFQSPLVGSSVPYTQAKWRVGWIMFLDHF